ncbi:YebC/PmpR family DNA-binding transcriptional regulator [bacterium]|nr:YebC/PmpR family DNA-binding transcriptional regulator [bacterium]
MSGHSKWSTIKHKKAKTDAQRGKIFTKIVREITTAARLGGGDQEMNPRLRLAVIKAKDANMPQDNIKRAIEKGAGNNGDDAYEDVMFEAYGPNGVAILIATLTDNRNRTVPNLRTILGKFGGSLANKGAVSYLFDQKGVFLFDATQYSEDQLMEVAISAGADELEQKESEIEVTCPLTSFEPLKLAFESAGYHPLSVSLGMVPQTVVTLSQADGERMVALLEKLEEDDDVQEVFANCRFTDE